MDLLTIQKKELENPDQASRWKQAFNEHYGTTFERCNIIVEGIEDIPSELLSVLNDRANISIPLHK